MQFERSGINSETLGNFDYVNQSLPACLVAAVDGKICVLHKGRNTLAQVRLSSCCEPLRQTLIGKSNGQYNNDSKIIRLYVYAKDKSVYYDLSGNRLGDELGIYEWFNS